MSRIEDEGYMNLVFAILEQSRNDLFSSDEDLRNSAIAFYKSEWYTELTGRDGISDMERILKDGTN